MTESRPLFRYVLERYPGQSVVLLALLILSGVAEGFGILTLLPLLEMVVDGGTGSGLAEGLVLGVLRGLGLGPTVGNLLVILVIAVWLKGGFRWLAMRRVGFGVARVARDFRLRLIRGLMRARWRHHANERSGEIATALSRDAFWASYAYRHFVGALAAGIQLAVYAVVVVVISWRVGLLALVAAALLAMVLGVFVRASRRAGADQTRLARSLVARLLDVVGGLKAIKAMGRERWYLPVLERETDELERAERRQVAAAESLRSLQEPLLALLLGPLVFIALAVDIPFATLLVGVFLFHRLLGRAHEVQTEYQGMAAAEAAFRAVTLQSEAAEAEGKVSPEGGRTPTLEEGIAVRDVAMSHGRRPALRGVSLTIPARRMTALTGESGAGKTTLLDLIVGLRDPEFGAVLVDGVSVTELDPGAWRSRVGYVPQEPVLLDDTIARNVALGEEVTEAAIERALRRAGAWSFVQSLPEGPDTMVGERGASLSGGERQRVAVARALLHDPLLLILDEPTSELDAKTEAELCAMLRSLRGEVTILAASHRNAIAEAADVRYELARGRLVDGRTR